MHAYKPRVLILFTEFSSRLGIKRFYRPYSGKSRKDWREKLVYRNRNTSFRLAAKYVALNVNFET